MNERKLKILFLDSNLGKGGGIDRYNSHVLNSLKSLGHAVEIVWLPDSSFLKKSIFAVSTFLRYIAFRPDVIFCGHVNISPLALFINRFSGTDYLVFTHGTDVWNLERSVVIKSLKKAKLIATVSGYTRKRIIRQIPEAESRVYLLPNTINSDKFRPKEKSGKLIEKYGLKGKKIVFTLARLSGMEGYKGYDRVIKSLPEVLEKVPETVYILGGKGDSLEEIRNLVKSMGLEKNVITPGFIPDDELVDYYNLADVYVMPSKKEGFGIVFLEAMACGTPVIAGNQDGSGEPLLDGKLGFMVDPDDENELAGNIISVLKENIRGDDRVDGSYLRRKVIENFGIARFEEKVKGLVEKLVSNSLV